MTSMCFLVISGLLIGVRGLVTFDISGRDLKDFPAGSVPVDAEKVAASDNSISALKPHILENNSKLIIFEISNNALCCIDPSAFAGTPLKLLSVRLNILTEIPDLLEVSTTLEILKAGDNRITDLRNVLKLPKLVQVHLENNCLVHLDLVILCKLINLKQFYVSRNKIESVAGGANITPTRDIQVKLAENVVSANCSSGQLLSHPGYIFKVDINCHSLLEALKQTCKGKET